jgi:hypothetical protein
MYTDTYVNIFRSPWTAPQLHAGRLCHGSGCWLPAFQCRCLGSIPGQSIKDLWWTIWHLDVFIPGLQFSPVSIIPPMLHTHFCLCAPLTGRTNWQILRTLTLSSPVMPCDIILLILSFMCYNFLGAPKNCSIWRTELKVWCQMASRDWKGLKGKALSFLSEHWLGKYSFFPGSEVSCRPLYSRHSPVIAVRDPWTAISLPDLLQTRCANKTHCMVLLSGPNCTNPETAEQTQYTFHCPLLLPSLAPTHNY